MHYSLVDQYTYKQMGILVEGLKVSMGCNRKKKQGFCIMEAEVRECDYHR